jgi:acetylornithine deacetylase
MTATATTEERLRRAVAARRDDIAELARALVSLDTTARLGNEPARQEAELQALLAERLRRVGASVDVWEPAPDAIAPWARQIGSERLSFAGRPQLVARFAGRGGGRSLVFNGHIDAVSYEPRSEWSVDPLAGEVADGRLVARGAVDMKGPIAAMVVAAEAVAAELGPLGGDLIVNTVTDEESSGAGALACIAEGLDADGVIVPEPTGFDVWVACRGSLTPTFRVAGRPGHAELPHPPWEQGGAVNAIEKLGVLLEAVQRLRADWAEREDQQHRYLAPGTIVPVIVEGGEWFVTYPAEARLTCELMYLPAAADDQGEGRHVERELLEWLERVVADSGDGWLARHPPVIEWGSDIPPAEIDAGHPLAVTTLAAAREGGLTGKISGFNSWYDGASFVRTRGIPAVAFGPPATASAHAIDESVRIDDLVACAQALAVAAARWCDAA